MLSTEDLYFYLETNKELSIYHCNKIIDDINKLQEMLKPYGIVNEDVDLYALKDKTLILILIWQHELFAIKHFKENSSELPNKNIFGIFV